MTTDPNSSRAPTLSVKMKPGQTEAQSLAEIALDPSLHATVTAERFNRGSFGEMGTTETFKAIANQAKAVAAGDASHMQAMLAGQAIALNSIFTEMARRGAANMGEHLNATDIYLRMALKAQAQCRSTIETLDKLANGHVQTIKHVHVNEGGQAIVADEFHHHSGGQQNGQSSGQPHATGTGPTCASEALPSPDPTGHPMPGTSRARKRPMPDARGQG